MTDFLRLNAAKMTTSTKISTAHVVRSRSQYIKKQEYHGLWGSRWLEDVYLRPFFDPWSRSHWSSFRLQTGFINYRSVHARIQVSVCSDNDFPTLVKT